MPVTWRTKPTYMAECECGWTCYAGNALGAAGIHFRKCGRRVRVESTVTFIYDPEGNPWNNPAHSINKDRQARASDAK